MVDSILVNNMNEKPDHYEQRTTMTYQLNVRTMLTAFINGTDGWDVTRSLVLMGLGSKSFERTFYRKSGYMHKIIMGVTKRFVHTALLDDIYTSIVLCRGNLPKINKLNHELKISENVIKSKKQICDVITRKRNTKIKNT